MPTNNIFSASGKRGIFVRIVYNELMKREFVTYEDVLRQFRKNNQIDFCKHGLETAEGYGVLRKVFPEVIRVLSNVIPDCIETNGKKGKGKAFRYIGESDDPLQEDKRAIEQKSIEDFVVFCKASAGILPASWFSAFFENTQLLLDANREKESGATHISAGLEQILTNINLLPRFYQAITNQQVLHFMYQPFGHEPFELTFHPQYLKEFNGRWFVFGEADREPFKAYNVPLDRIVGDITVVEGVDYIPAEKGFYQRFFNNIIGVTHEGDAKEEVVVIRTKTKYQHGLLLTKPLHHSQKETLAFGEYEDGSYGELTLTIEPNRELCGRIMMYGAGLEVVKPLSLREKITAAIEAQLKQYIGNER